MRKIMFYILLLKLINISLNFFPIWDFDKVAKLIQYGGYLSYIKFNEDSNNIHIDLSVNIEIKDDTIIERTEHLIIDGEWYTPEIIIKDIESGYNNTKNIGYHSHIICPKGKSHAYSISYRGSSELKPKGFNEDSDWELKCFWEIDKNILYIGYLQKDIFLYQYNLKDNKFDDYNKINNGIFDFKWNINYILNTDNQKQIFSLLKSNNDLILSELKFYVYENELFDFESISSRNIANLKTNISAYFHHHNESNHFYWMTYNDALDFDSGYYIGDEKLTHENLNTINIINNLDNSPFDYIEKITFKEIKLIPYTRYAYYKIYNENTDETYYGMIDISLNKIIFNTNLDLKYFKPYSNNSMLAFYNGNFYLICAIEENGICLDECPSGKIPVHNVNEKNECASKHRCPWEINLIPNNICINTCDENIYYYNSTTKECGFCKDMFKDKQYKMINVEGCLSDQPKNSYFINEKKLLLACNGGLEFKDGKCGDDTIECEDNCKVCEENPNNPVETICTSCKDTFELKDGKCICLDGYFENNQKCENCDIGCEKCSSSSDNCSKCKIGYYHVENGNKCNKCSEFCETCSKGEENDVQNCLTCNQNGEYKFFYNNNCLENCPENTTISKGNICVKEDINNDDNKNDKEKDSDNNTNKDKLFLSIFMALFSIIFLMLMICFCIKNCCKTINNYDDDVSKDIYTELK